MRKIEVKIRQIIWALKQMKKPTTYDFVIYEKNKYYIKSSLSGHDVWSLFDPITNDRKHSHIVGSALKVVQSPKRNINAFKRHLKFQEQNWGSIDRINPVGTRLSYNNEDDIQFYKSKSK